MFENDQLRRAVRFEGGISRRLFLAYSTVLSSIPLIGLESSAEESPSFASEPFTLGVASGDPDHQSVVLWTRLAPQPLQPGGGMPAKSIVVNWEVGTDESMTSIVASGVSVASPQLGHSVHVEVDGLRPDRWYWYRFRAGDAYSPLGRTRTLPAPEVMPDGVRFAVTSCQHYEQGLFTAYEQMVRDNVDLVFHLGDYIYEGARNPRVRAHQGGEIESLDDYRARYAQYRGDAHLQKMHASCPWFVTWDDHEFDNNCANDISEEAGIDPVAFLERRANAYQAYYEMMPLRRSSLPAGSDMQLYRAASYGRLAELLVLDTRQYRTNQPNNDRRSPLNEAALSTANSLLGRKQKNWLCKSLVTSQAKWNVLAQQVMMGLVKRSVEDNVGFYSMDQWPGYAAERMQLMRYMSERKIANPVVLTGDIHSNWANELRVDDRKEDQPLVGTEFVATSLTSGGNGREKPSNLDSILSNNACVKFHNAERGYILCDVTPESWTSDYKVIDEVLKPGGKTTSRARFVVEAGIPKINKA